VRDCDDSRGEGGDGDGDGDAHRGLLRAREKSVSDSERPQLDPMKKGVLLEVLGGWWMVSVDGLVCCQREAGPRRVFWKDCRCSR
jgi:hypothetical protein